MTVMSLPVISPEAGFTRYLQEIKKFPSLTHDEEYTLSQRFIEYKDITAAHQLVTSHLKLVAKIATSFKGYGLPLIELVSEGNIGLMQAVKRFNPELGFRLSTYATWWIKAAIQEYILKSWSLVKIGTTAAQKKLFFNLGKIKKKLLNVDQIEPNDLAFNKAVAIELNVKEKEVSEMNSRMAAMDLSLNSIVSEEGSTELLELVPESRANQEVNLSNNQELSRKKSLFRKAMNKLTKREQVILSERHLQEEPSTLENLSQQYKVSRERIRQIEARALDKLRKEVQAEYHN